MKRVYYESHNMENRIVIFHHDTLKKKPTDYLTGFNWHKNIEILSVTKGTGIILCDSEVYPVSEGDIFIINSNQLHGLKTEDILLYDCLIIDSDFLAQNEIPVTDFQFDHVIRSETVTSLYYNIVEEFESDAPFRTAGIRAKVLPLMVYLLRHHAKKLPNTAKTNTTADSIKLALEFINREYARKLTLEEIANAAGLSKYHFAREFKRLTHTTVTSYVNIIRCNHAKLLLKSQKYSVQAAALSCGFENLSFFTKTFQSIMGYLPSELKEKGK